MELADGVMRSIDEWHVRPIRQWRMDRADVLEGFGSYRHTLSWDRFGLAVLGRGARVLSAKVELFKLDEFGSFGD